MATNPPTLDARLAAVIPDTWLDPLLSGSEALPGLDRCDGRVIEALCAAIRARLTALIAADPPAATVTVLCECGHGGNKAVPHPKECCVESLACRCRKWTPTTARVTYERALTEEERNG